MTNKDFKSKLFDRIISKDDEDYFPLLFAETLFRLKVVDELNCNCYECDNDRRRLTRGLREMFTYPIISDRKGLKDYDYRNCGRVKKKS